MKWCWSQERSEVAERGERGWVKRGEGVGVETLALSCEKKNSFAEEVFSDTSML